MSSAIPTDKNLVPDLFSDQHFPSGGEIAGIQCGEIDTTRYTFSEPVAAIPIGCPPAIGIISRRLMPQTQPTNRVTIVIMNRERDL